MDVGIIHPATLSEGCCEEAIAIFEVLEWCVNGVIVANWGNFIGQADFDFLELAAPLLFKALQKANQEHAPQWSHEVAIRIAHADLFSLDRFSDLLPIFLVLLLIAIFAFLQQQEKLGEHTVRFQPDIEAQSVFGLEFLQQFFAFHGFQLTQCVVLLFVELSFPPSGAEATLNFSTVEGAPLVLVAQSEEGLVITMGRLGANCEFVLRCQLIE